MVRDKAEKLIKVNNGIQEIGMLIKESYKHDMEFIAYRTTERLHDLLLVVREMLEE